MRRSLWRVQAGGVQADAWLCSPTGRRRPEEASPVPDVRHGAGESGQVSARPDVRVPDAVFRVRRPREAPSLSAGSAADSPPVRIAGRQARPAPRPHGRSSGLAAAPGWRQHPLTASVWAPPSAPRAPMAAVIVPRGQQPRRSEPMSHAALTGCGTSCRSLALPCHME